MSIQFSSLEISRIEAALQALLSPLHWHDADRWRDVVLCRVAELLEADRAMFGMGMPCVDTPYRLLGAEPRELMPYLEHYQFVDPLNAIIPEMEDGIVSTTLLATRVPGGPSGYYTSEVYSDYYRPLGLEDHLSVVVQPQLEPATSVLHGATAVLSAYRSRYGTELFGEKGLAIMRLLRSALQSGLEALHALARYRASLVQMVDVMREAAWLCNAEGTVLHQNGAMTLLLSSEPESERLEHALRSAVSSLHRLAQQRGGARNFAMQPRLPHIHTRRARYRVRGSLLAHPDDSTRPTLIVVLERYGRAADPVMLQERFGLTRQQARVALLIARRRRNREIAELLSITPNTARRHTDSVLLKLGVHSRDAIEDAIRRVLCEA